MSYLGDKTCTNSQCGRKWIRGPLAPRALLGPELVSARKDRSIETRLYCLVMGSIGGPSAKALAPLDAAARRITAWSGARAFVV